MNSQPGTRNRLAEKMARSQGLKHVYTPHTCQYCAKIIIKEDDIKRGSYELLFAENITKARQAAQGGCPLFKYFVEEISETMTYPLIHFDVEDVSSPITFLPLNMQVTTKHLDFGKNEEGFQTLDLIANSGETCLT